MLHDATLISMADADLTRTQAIAAQYGTVAHPHVAALLRDVGAVSIAVPTFAHCTVTKAALEGGVHVLVKKPITVTQSEALELIELAERQNLILQVRHIERFNSVIKLIIRTSASSVHRCPKLNALGLVRWTQPSCAI